MSQFVVATVLVILQSSFLLNAQSEKSECLSNKDCPSDQLCAEFKCINPCLLNLCENPKSCKVTNHIPVCSNNCAEYSGVLANSGPSQSRKEKKYQLNTIVKMNWYHALAQCTVNNMRLATIDSKQEHDRLIEQIHQSGLKEADFWTSGTDQGDYGNYLWMSSGKPITYFDWFNGEPNHWNHNGTIESCIEIHYRHNYQMNDVICLDHNFYICEFYV